MYVIDIQVGKKIRAFIRKGHLTPYLVDSVSGPELLVIDDLGAIARGVEVNLDGRAYRADAEGRIRLPYSESGRAGT